LSAAALLIGELLLRDIDLVVDGDQLRCRGPKGALTPELAGRITALKPELRQRLLDQEGEIAWRIRVMLISDPVVFSILDLEPVAGQCSSCAEPQPYGQDGRCTLCSLAGIRVGRVVDGKDAPPEDDPVPVHTRVRLPSWDCPCGANVVGDWTWCPSCRKSKAQGNMSHDIPQEAQLMLEVVS